MSDETDPRPHSVWVPPAGTLPSPPPAVTAPEPGGRRRRRVGPPVVAAVAALLVVGVVAGSLLAWAGQPRASAQPLALSFSVGDRQTYVVHMTMKGAVSAPSLGASQPVDMEVTQTMTWRVTDVDREGIATVEVTDVDMTGTVNGMQVPSAGPMPAVEMRIAPDGRILSAGGLSFSGIEQTGGAGFPGAGQVTPLLPDHPVAPGDTWTKDFSQEMPFGTGTISFTARNTLEGYDEVHGVRAAVIRSEYTVPMDFTLRFEDLLAAVGDQMAGASAADLATLEDASIAYGGSGTISMKAWLDTDRRQLLRSDSSGSFDITMRFSGVPGLDGSFGFVGDFTQALEIR